MQKNLPTVAAEFSAQLNCIRESVSHWIWNQCLVSKVTLYSLWWATAVPEAEKQSKKFPLQTFRSIVNNNFYIKPMNLAVDWRDDALDRPCQCRTDFFNRDKITQMNPLYGVLQVHLLTVWWKRDTTLLTAAELSFLKRWKLLGGVWSCNCQKSSGGVTAHFSAFH